MKPLRCLHPALNHGDTPGERCARRWMPSFPAGAGGQPVSPLLLAPGCTPSCPSHTSHPRCRPQSHCLTSCGAQPRAAAVFKHRVCSSGSGEVTETSPAPPWHCPPGIAPPRGGRREEAETGLGGGWASREEKVGLSAGFPECYLLLLKINDALERFHFVSLTARPLHQPGRRMRRCSQRLLSALPSLLSPSCNPASSSRAHQNRDLQPGSADCLCHPSLGFIPMIYHARLPLRSHGDTSSGKLLPRRPHFYRGKRRGVRIPAGQCRGVTLTWENSKFPSPQVCFCSLCCSGAAHAGFGP